MIIAIVAILSLLLGLAGAAVIGIGVISSQLADLKAYTMTQIDLLQHLNTRRPVWEFMTGAPE